jgi:DNA-binding transcriptional regulator YhcF (GntR family)
VHYARRIVPRPKLERVTAVLRERIRDAATMGALTVGERLPGTRALAEELNVDPRLIGLALRRLEQERLVEIQPRSGAYVAAGAGGDGGDPRLPPEWVTELVAQSVERGMPAQSLAADLKQATDTDKVRAAVIAATSDQAVGMVRELQEDYGIAAAAVFPSQLASRPRALLRAHLVLTTTDLERTARSITVTLGKSLVVVRVRPDLFSEDWIAFMRSPVYVVVADPRFRAMLRHAIQPIPGSSNVTIVLANGEETTRIPPDAPTYVTESARRMLGRAGLPGRTIRPRRVFSSATVREVAAFLVAHNQRRSAR